ncbi:MAG: tetratricopeptide repeat protein [Bacteroidetes bacterium]|nr:tetratricopeptide repeat protein [Bacteroidota bacterium]
MMTKTRKERTPEQKDFDKVNEAIDNISSGDLESAKTILEKVTANVPTDYKNEYKKDGKLHIKFWDKEAFMHYADWILKHGSGKEKDVYWVGNAYPRAYYYLGYIHVEEGNYQKAIELFDEGLRLEPTNPNFKTEKAAAYQSTGNNKKAISFYNQVPDIGLYVSKKQKARALRGKGVALIDLNKFASAKKALKKSLQIEPDNERARAELHYISNLRVGGKRVSSDIFDPRR